jgi:hypothetical protein
VFLCLEFEKQNDDQSPRRQSTTSLEKIRNRLQVVLLFPQANALEQSKRLLSRLNFRSCLNHEISFPIVDDQDLNMMCYILGASCPSSVQLVLHKLSTDEGVATGPAFHGPVIEEPSPGLLQVARNLTTKKNSI